VTYKDTHLNAQSRSREGVIEENVNTQHFSMLKPATGFAVKSNFFLHPLTLSGKGDDSDKMFRMGDIQNYETKNDETLEMKSLYTGFIRL